MKIRTRKGIFEVEKVFNDYFLGSNRWVKTYVCYDYDYNGKKIPYLVQEQLVLEVIN